MPSFNGSAIFGTQVVMATDDNPRASQENDFPALNGIESLDQGFRGRVTKVAGRLSGTSAADLNSALGLFRSYNDGNAYVLEDNFGNDWSNVKYGSFELQGRVRVGTGGIFYQDYTATFLHLTS